MCRFITHSQAFSRLPGKPASPISFSDDLSIYRSDIRKDNFLHDISTGDIWIIDFQHIGVLPDPFQTFAFFNIGSSLATAVSRHLGYKSSDIADKMTRASGVLRQISGNASLSKSLHPVLLAPNAEANVLSQT